MPSLISIKLVSMKATVKKRIIWFNEAMLENGETIPLRTLDSSKVFEDGQEIEGYIHEYDEQIKYANGEHAREYQTHRTFIV